MRILKPIPRLFATAAVGLWLTMMCQSSFALTEEERQQRLEALRHTIQNVNRALEKVKSDRSEVQKTLEDSETKIGELNQKIMELKKQLEDKQSHLKTLRANKEELAHAKKQQTQSASTHFNAAYRLGSQSSMKLLLNQQSPSHVSRNLKYYDYIVKARTEKIERFAETLKQLNTIEPKIASDLHYIERQRKELARQQASLKSKQAERKQTLAQLDKTVSNTGDKLNALNKDRASLETLLVHVAKAAKHLPSVTSSASTTPKKPFTQLKGKLPWPTTGQVLQAYGSERVKGKVRWQGVVIGANEGAPVRSIHHGHVVFCDYLRGQGLLIIIDHGAGFMSLYAHNQSLYKQLGDWVEGGEHIASVGASGGQKAAGLYFELRFKGEPTNPQRWLTRA